MDSLNPLKLIELLFELIDKYIPSPYKEFILGAFGFALLIGMIYGFFFRGFVLPPSAQRIRSESSDEDDDEEDGERPSTPLRRQLEAANTTIKDLEDRLRISSTERYYLYFNGIANASLMLAFAVLLDRNWSGTQGNFSIQQQINTFISILLVGLVTSIILNVIVDVLAGSPTRRTDIINRAFVIAFAMNALVFLAYHFGYLRF